jgi:hypothetical protein
MKFSCMLLIHIAAKVKLAQMESLSKLIITLPFQVRSVEVSGSCITYCIASKVGPLMI